MVSRTKVKLQYVPNRHTCTVGSGFSILQSETRWWVAGAVVKVPLQNATHALAAFWLTHLVGLGIWSCALYVTPSFGSVVFWNPGESLLRGRSLQTV